MTNLNSFSFVSCAVKLSRMPLLLFLQCAQYGVANHFERPFLYSSDKV